MFTSMAWHGTLVAPVLTLWSYCSLVLRRRCEHTNWSIKICCHVAMFILMARCRTEVAPVLTHWSCCSLALRHQYQYASCFIYVAVSPWSYWSLGVELWRLQCWYTGVAAVLRCAISVSTQVALNICCDITMVTLMDWSGTVVAPVLTHWSCCSLALCHQCQYASCFIHMLTCSHGHIDGLAWDCSSSSADALELLQSCAVPSVSVHKLFYTYVDMFSWSYWWLGVGLW